MRRTFQLTRFHLLTYVLAKTDIGMDVAAPARINSSQLVHHLLCELLDFTGAPILGQIESTVVRQVKFGVLSLIRYMIVI